MSHDDDKCREFASRRRAAQRTIYTSLFALGLAITVWSAILAKRGVTPPSLAQARAIHLDPSSVLRGDAAQGHAENDRRAGLFSMLHANAPTVEALERAALAEAVFDPAAIRYYAGRPIRPVRRVWMTVTAYSPDERSCGVFADGITASGRSVWTNGGRLVAADRSVLPFGTLLTIPGYSDDEAVPVLDVGGAIKGARLDVLYPTHRRAMRWGVRRLPVTVWEYADE